MECKQQNVISCGWNHTAVITRDGKVVCWGCNDHSKCEPPHSLENAAAVSCGAAATVALTREGELVYWGPRRSGATSGSMPSHVVAICSRTCGYAVTSDGAVTCWDCIRTAGERCATPPLLDDVSAVTVGTNHFVAALTRSGTVRCWGGNLFGRCYPPCALDDVIDVSCGGGHVAAVTREGKVICWGWNPYSQCDVPESLGAVIAISCGYGHTAALLRDGTVVCWGLNSRRQCTVPTSLTTVVAISAGGYHTAAVTRDGKVVCWGNNDNGQCSVPDLLVAMVFDEVILM